MIEINGAHGEGGGQILRSSLTLAALTGKPVTVHHIRSKRSQPGLRPQHLAAVKAIARITHGHIEGAVLNSQQIQLSPQSTAAGNYKFKIPTAGALSLLLQTIFLPLSFADGRSEVVLTGGTHVRWSPTCHYLQSCWLPLMETLGFRAQIALEKAGYYPRGGGKVRLTILPAQSLKPFICLDRGQLLRIRGYSGVSNLTEEIATRQKHQALRRLYDVCRDSKIKTLHLPSPGKGTFILLKAIFENCGCACYSALGAPGKPAERVADEAVDELFSFMETDGCVDHFMADQLLLPLSLIPGKSAFHTNRLTQNVLTNANVIQAFLPLEIKIKGDLGSPALIEIKGIGLQ